MASHFRCGVRGFQVRCAVFCFVWCPNDGFVDLVADYNVKVASRNIPHATSGGSSLGRDASVDISPPVFLNFLQETMSGCSQGRSQSPETTSARPPRATAGPTARWLSSVHLTFPSVSEVNTACLSPCPRSPVPVDASVCQCLDVGAEIFR